MSQPETKKNYNVSCRVLNELELKIIPKVVREISRGYSERMPYLKGYCSTPFIQRGKLDYGTFASYVAYPIVFESDEEHQKGMRQAFIRDRLFNPEVCEQFVSQHWFYFICLFGKNIKPKLFIHDSNMIGNIYSQKELEDQKFLEDAIGGKLHNMVANYAEFAEKQNHISHVVNLLNSYKQKMETI